MNSSSLQDYRLAHPLTVAVPTLTQSQGLGYILARIEQKKLVRERRRARRQNLLRGIQGFLRGLIAFAPRFALHGSRQPRLAPAAA